MDIYKRGTVLFSAGTQSRQHCWRIYFGAARFFAQSPSFLPPSFRYHLPGTVVSVGVSFAEVGAYFFIRHPVDNEFSLDIPGNLWSIDEFLWRSHELRMSVPIYPAASPMHVFMLLRSHEKCNLCSLSSVIPLRKTRLSSLEIYVIERENS